MLYLHLLETCKTENIQLVAYQGKGPLNIYQTFLLLRNLWYKCQSLQNKTQYLPLWDGFKALENSHLNIDVRFTMPTLRSRCLACSMSRMEQQWTSCRRCSLLWCSVCSSSSCILRCSLSWLNWCWSCCSDDWDWDSCISRLCFNREI